MNPIISIVIPFYNAETYLKANVERVIQSTNLEIEIILVNDASIDNSLKIAELLSEKYSNIKVMSLETNSGAGVARNSAIQFCKGEYTLFFDSDDHINLQALEMLYKVAIETNADLVLSAYDVSLNDAFENKFMPPWDKKIFDKLIGQNLYKTLTDLDKILAIQTINYPWNKLFKTKTLKLKKLQFGTTKVQNDILGHWMGIIESDIVVMTHIKIAVHYSGVTSGSITTISDLRRLQSLNALKSLHSYLKSDHKIWDSYSFSYAIFFIRLVYWAEMKIESTLKETFIAETYEIMKEQRLLKFYRFSQIHNLGIKHYIYSLKFLHRNTFVSSLNALINLFKLLKKLGIMLKKLIS